MTSETIEAEESDDERTERNVEDERYADGEDQDAVRDGQYADVDTCHLDDVADGCGCAEVWKHTSGQRAAECDAGAD